MGLSGRFSVWLAGVCMSGIVESFVLVLMSSIIYLGCYVMIDKIQIQVIFCFTMKMLVYLLAGRHVLTIWMYWSRFFLQLTAVHLVDAHLCSDPGKYVGALLLSLSTMLHLELPHINVLSKIDLIESYGQLGKDQFALGLVCLHGCILAWLIHNIQEKECSCWEVTLYVDSPFIYRVYHVHMLIYLLDLTLQPSTWTSIRTFKTFNTFSTILVKMLGLQSTGTWICLLPEIYCSGSILGRKFAALLFERMPPKGGQCGSYWADLAAR